MLRTARRTALFCTTAISAVTMGCAVAVAEEPQAGSAPAALPGLVVTAASPIARDGAVVADDGLPGLSPVTAGSFVPVTLVDRDQLDFDAGRTLGDVLDAEPGITASSFAPGASRPVIRGLDSERVRVQENGIGAHDVSALGEDHGVPIDPLAAERVEVIRGPATLRWGSQAIGGVVDVSNDRIPVDIAPGQSRGRVQGGFGSTAEDLDGAVSLTTRHGGVALHADAFGRRAGDYDLPDGGTQANSSVKADGQSIGGSYIFDNGYIGTSLSRYGSVYDIPGGEEAELQTRIDMEQVTWRGLGEYRPERGWLSAVRVWAGYSRYDHDEIGLAHEHEHEDDHDDHDHDHDHDDDHDEHDEAEEGAHVHGSYASRDWEGRIELQHVPVATAAGPLDGALGLQLTHQKLTTTGEADELLAPAETLAVAGYVFEELALGGGLRLQAAGRLERTRVTGQAADFPADLLPGADDPALSSARKDFLAGSGSIGVLQDLPHGLVARATAQYVERAPSAAELFSKGSHHASGTFEIGNPGLDTEAATTLEIGLARDTGRLRFDAAAFYTRFDGFIYKRLTGVTCDEDFASCGGSDGEFDQVAYSQQDAVFYGTELKARFDLADLAGGVIGLDGRYDLVHAEFDGGDNVPRIPPQRLGGGIWWADDAWWARVGILHAFDQTRMSVNETSTDGYDMLEAELSYTTAFTSGGVPTLVTFGVKGTNLLDEEIRNAVSFKKDEVLAPGRGVRAFASLKF
ncbi:TonB-dependent receptor [Tistrella sp. BH-R2-4]|uniref:TonB-dependent receptor n=1 Tax=Tistrella arctica TaxID=3133430 RepID=A0ABU9YDP7_9PROT